MMPHYDNSKSPAQERREYADLVARRKDIERTIARTNGTLEPRSRRVKRAIESVLAFSFIGRYLRDLF